MNRKGMIVYSYEELKRFLPEVGTRGLWCFQANFHDGHKRCAEAVQYCDSVIGIMFNSRDIEERWMAGETNLEHFPIKNSDIDMLRKYSDIGLILTEEYQPFKNYWEDIKAEFEEQFPIECLKEKGVLDDRDSYNGLLHGIAFRYMLHGVYGIHIDYQSQGGKDRYRSVGYVDYVFDRWGVRIDLIDSVCDEFGNSISRTVSGLPKQLKERLNKPLLKPEFKSINEVKEHINTIEGLYVLNFYRTDKWVHATFSFYGYKAWTEGVRCKS